MTPAEKLAAGKQRRPPRPRRVKLSRPGGLPCFRRRAWPACRLREVRNRLGLTLKEVGAAVGMSLTALADVEHGAEVMLATARRLAAFYGESVEELWPMKEGVLDE